MACVATVLCSGGKGSPFPQLAHACFRSGRKTGAGKLLGSEGVAVRVQGLTILRFSGGRDYLWIIQPGDQVNNMWAVLCEFRKVGVRIWFGAQKQGKKWGGSWISLYFLR